MSNSRDDTARSFRLRDGGRAQSPAALSRGRLVGDQTVVVDALADAQLDVTIDTTDLDTTDLDTTDLDTTDLDTVDLDTVDLDTVDLDGADRATIDEDLLEAVHANGSAPGFASAAPTIVAARRGASVPVDLPVPGQTQHDVHAGPSGRRPLDEGLDQLPGDARRQQSFSPRACPYRGGQLMRWCGLQQEAGRTSTEGLVDVFVEIERREHQDPGRRAGVENALGGLNAVAIGHFDVHEHDIRGEGVGHRGRGGGP